MEENGIYMVVDIDRCWGCKACQVACKQEHGIPAGESGNIDVAEVSQRDEKGGLHCDHVPVLCQQCVSPACMEVCPVGAIGKNEEQLVRIDREACIGCGQCAEACPFGCIHIGMINGEEKAQKCDYCEERRKRGFLPSCEQHCPGGAFTSCDQEKMLELTKGRYHYQTGRTVYTSDKLCEMGKYLGSGS